MMEMAFHPLQPTKAYLCFLSVLPLVHVDPNKWKKVSAVPVRGQEGSIPLPQVCPMWLWPVFISRPSQPCEPHAASDTVTPVPWADAAP